MSTDTKNTNVKDHDGAGRHDSNRGNDAAGKTGHQSQDASRHQQDASHHKDDRRPQPDGADNRRGQQSQGGSQKGSDSAHKGGLSK
jgi:hypothetical protein